MDRELILIKYLLNFFKVIVFDYDEYYLTLLKNALKYGMTRDEFYNNNLKEYYCYEEAYIEKIHEQSHIQGLYSYIALQTIASNLLSKKGEKPLEYPKKDLYLQEKESNINNKTKKITKDNLHKKYMNSLLKCY